MIELARRAVACVPVTEWPVGTRLKGRHSKGGDRIIHPWDGDYLVVHDEWENELEEIWTLEGIDWYPDFKDSATLGCLVALVRKAYGGNVYTIPPSCFFLTPLGGGEIR